jgi:uncharacterized protein YkwD
MKNKSITTLIALFTFLCTTLYAQEPKSRCYYEVDGKKIECSCDLYKPHKRPEYTYNWDVDSVEKVMEEKLIYAINNHRVSIGLNPLVYSQRLFDQLTLPHNLYQVKNQYCGHDDHMGNKLKERGPALNYCGFKSLGENVADHQRWDGKGRSHLFEQYMDSPPHRALIENPKWVYYSTSVIYNVENNRFYNTFNVSK